MTTSREDVVSSDEEQRFRPFAFLLGIAVLFQLASVHWLGMNLRALPPTTIGLVELCLLISSLRLIWTPTARWLIIQAIFELLGFLISLPHMPNHRLITATMSFGVLLTALSAYARKREPLSTQIATLLFPALRVCALVVYFFAVFHKLNRDFFSPELSCATLFFGHILEVVPVLPKWPLVLQSLPYLTLLVEGGIPLLLLFQRTRTIGVLVGFLFHTSLTFDVEKHFFDFSSTMFVLLSLFLPAQVWSRIFTEISKRAVLRNGNLLRAFTVAYVVFVTASLWYDSLFAMQLFFSGRQLLWWIVNAIFARLLLVGLRERRDDASLPIVPAGVCVLLPILLALNGIAPYLGVKTRSAIDMYSNLRVENGWSNHWIVRHPADLLGKMSDLVRVIDTSSKELKTEYADSGLLVTYFELRSYLSLHPNTRIKYERNGIVYDLPKASDDTELVKPIPILLRKLLWFRPVDPNPIGARCQW